MSTNSSSRKEAAFSKIGNTAPQRILALPLFLLHLPLALFIGFQPNFEIWDLQTSARVAFTIAFALYVNVSFLYRERFWSVPSLTFLILTLFHLGLFASIAVTGTPPTLMETGEFSSSWFFSEATTTAVKYVLVGLVSYSAGLTLSTILWSPNKSVSSNRDKTQDKRVLEERFAVFGLALLVISALSWFILTITTAGAQLLFNELYGLLEGYKFLKPIELYLLGHFLWSHVGLLYPKVQTFVLGDSRIWAFCY